MARVRLDRKATSISLLVVIGMREDGQKVLLAIKSMGGESTEAWRTVLDDLIKRGLRRPEFLIVDGAPGLDKAIAAVWDGVPVQRCSLIWVKSMLIFSEVLILMPGSTVGRTTSLRFFACLMMFSRDRSLPHCLIRCSSSMPCV